MKICIVGHGPSLKGAKKGTEIDSFDKVVRLKGSSTVIGSEDYGRRIDALCASTEIMGTFFKVDSPEYWAYPKKGTFDQLVFLQVITKLEKPILLPLHYCNEWNSKFRELGPSHPNVSTGMAAILIALMRWKPESITLAGFDTLLDPSIEFERNDLIPVSGLGKLAGHDWAKENELLKIAAHSVKVASL